MEFFSKAHIPDEHTEHRNNSNSISIKRSHNKYSTIERAVIDSSTATRVAAVSIADATITKASSSSSASTPTTAATDAT